jgi:uncharacterized protein (DUF1684 family)
MTARWAAMNGSRGWLQSMSLAVLLAGTILLAGISLAAPRHAQAQASVTSAEPEWRQDLDRWRARRAQEIDAPDGWLTLVALDWLKPGANSIGAAADNQTQIHADVPDHIGLLIVSGKTVQLLPIAGGLPDDLTIDGKPAHEGPLVVEGAKPSIIGLHGVSMIVLERGDRFALRIKDANAPARKAFHGLNWFPPDPNFSVTAQWIPFTPPQIERIPTVIGTTLELPAPGVAEFQLNGVTYRLEPVLESPGDKELFFILRDLTSKDSTYQAARFLHTPFPDHGLDKPGTLILDFNRLENPPCAYTSYATCPLPPEKNRLPVAIDAGEKRYTP